MIRLALRRVGRLVHPLLQQHRRLWPAAVLLRQLEEQRGGQSRLRRTAQQRLQNCLQAVSDGQRSVAGRCLGGEGERRGGAPLLVVLVELLPERARGDVAVEGVAVGGEELGESGDEGDAFGFGEGGPGAREEVNPESTRHCWEERRLVGDSHVAVGEFDQVCCKVADGGERGGLFESEGVVDAGGCVGISICTIGIIGTITIISTVDMIGTITIISTVDMIGIITIVNTNTIHHNTQRREMTHRRIQLQ